MLHLVGITGTINLTILNLNLKVATSCIVDYWAVGGYANKHIDLDYPDVEPATLPEFIATEN